MINEKYFNLDVSKSCMLVLFLYLNFFNMVLAMSLNYNQKFEVTLYKVIFGYHWQYWSRILQNLQEIK